MAQTIMSNISLGLTTTGSSFTAVAYSIFSSIYYPMEAYLMPPSLFFGVLNNSLVFLVIFGGRQFREKTSTTAVMYYGAIAFADTLSVLCVPIPLFLGDGLSIITNDKVYFYVDVDEVPCHAWRTALVFAEGFLGWTLVLFNFERYVALQWPFFTRRFIKPRRVAIALIVLFGINILIGLLAIPVFKVISLKNNKVGRACQGHIAATSIEGIFEVFGLIFVGSSIPAFLLLIIMFLLFVKVERAKRKHIQLKKPTDSQAVKSTKSGETLAVAVTVSIIKFIFLFPFSVTFMISACFSSLLSSNVNLIVSYSHILINGASQIVHSFNFFVYVYLMPVFRSELLRIITCGKIVLK